MQRTSSNQMGPDPRPNDALAWAMPKPYPNIRQTTVASMLLKRSSQTVPHSLAIKTSSRPESPFKPFERRRFESEKGVEYHNENNLMSDSMSLQVPIIETKVELQSHPTSLQISAYIA